LISFRKQWYDNTEDQIVKATKLTIYNYFDMKKIIRTIKKRFLPIAPIYHLEFSRSKIFADVLIRIIDLLPNLITLKIDSLPCRKPAYLSKNKISKVYLQEMDSMDELDCLLAMCPYINHLEIEHLNNVDVQMVLDHILKKIHHNSHDQLRSLCLHIPTADDQMIQTLQKMIDDKTLLIDYIIKRVGDRVYLQWK
jgi:hypothetical protein